MSNYLGSKLVVGMLYHKLTRTNSIQDYKIDKDQDFPCKLHKKRYNLSTH